MQLTGGSCLFDFEYLFSDNHFQFIGSGQIGVNAVFFFAVEDFVPVQVHFQPTGIGRGQLDRDVARVLRAPKLRPQPRGDSVVPSRHTVNYLYFNFAKLCTGHGCSFRTGMQVVP